MTALRFLTERPESFLRRLKVEAPEPLLLRRAVSKLGLDDGPAMGAETVDALQQRVKSALTEGGSDQLRPRDVREACKVYLHPPEPPGRDRRVSAELLRLVQTLRRRAPFLALINAYLDSFDPQDGDVVALAGELRKLSADWEWRPGEPWPERAAAFDIFDPAKAPSRIADAMLSKDERPEDVLLRAGLDSDARRKGGLAEHAFRVGCRTVAEASAAGVQSKQARLIEWAKIASTQLAYPSSWPAYAAALFRPWRNTEPPEAHRKALIETAVSYANDPRVNEAKWRPVKMEAGDAYDVIVRWLTKASVEQFFDIVSATMTERPDMWEARRRFWTAYLKANLISAAWVAFGADGAYRADQAARRSNEPGLKMFGRLGSGRTSEHAALIMQIGDLVVVDWSHNGSWNIWPPDAKGRPVLFKHNTRGWADYDPRELMHAPVHGSHTANGSWEYRVREIIRDYTGLRP